LSLSRETLARMIDHTLLKPTATEEDFVKLCDEAKEYGFACACVSPTYVSLAAKLLEGTDVKVCTVVSFPLGSNTTEVKMFEAENAVKNGAQEIDMVVNIGALKAGKYDLVERDMGSVIRTVKAHGDITVKCIIDTCYLTKEEKVKVCLLAKQTGADYVKTSTGFGTHGATVEDVKLIRATLGREVGVKASGGIRTLKDTVAMIEAGASRIGTSTAVAIIKELV